MKYAKTKSAALLIAAFALTACDAAGPGAAIDTPPQPVTYKSFAAEQRSAGTNVVTVRTRAVAEVNGKKKSSEMVGVRCNLLGNGFQTSVITPAKVTVPVYRGATDPILASCSHNGIDAQNTLKASRIKPTTPVPTGLGLGGILVMAAVSAAVEANRNPALDSFRYPSRLNVDFPAATKAQ